jgi:YD repeat-containing protein
MIIDDDSVATVHGIHNKQVWPNSIDPGLNQLQVTGRGVKLHSDEFVRRDVDLRIPGRGFDWQFSRTYRSGITYNGPLGYNWDFEDNRRLIVVNAVNVNELRATFPTVKLGDVVRNDGEGRADLYDKPGNSFRAPAGFFTQLRANADGTYTERDASGNFINYGSPDANGLARMTRRSDRNDNAMTFEYDAQGSLRRVIDTLGRPIVYFYDANGRIMQVRDFASRSIRFSYDQNGDLVSATSPSVTGTPNGNDFPDGKTSRYTYSSGFAVPRLNHNLLTWTAPNEVATGGPARLILSYDNNSSSPRFDGVATQTIGGINSSGVPAGGTISYEYEILGPVLANDLKSPAASVTVTDRNGNQTVRFYNLLGNLLTKRELTNRNVRASDPEFFETNYSYNADVQRVAEAFSVGNQREVMFDVNGSRFQQGNALQQMLKADPTRTGDQNNIGSSGTYEPIYNQLHKLIEARGLDPTYVPQNGGLTSQARYTTTYTYDYQEGTNFAGLAAELGITAAAVQQILADARIPMGLGDVNKDGRTDQISGNLIRTEYPTVNLVPGSKQAMVEGDMRQEVVELFAYNNFGQLIREQDAEGNVSDYTYYAARDPDGDGTINNPLGDAVSGGYLRQVTRDTVNDPTRNSGTNPTPTNIRTAYSYDSVGNVTRVIDGRGIATDYDVNQLNQVVQITRAAAHRLVVPVPSEPEPLVDFKYVERVFYDFNNNVVKRQTEDRGNTSNVQMLPLALNDPQLEAGDANRDARFDSADLVKVFQAGEYEDGVARNSMWDEGDWNGDLEFDSSDLVAAFQTGNYEQGVYATAYVDYLFKYDILDNLIETQEEVEAGPTEPKMLVTRFRYDPNEHQVLTIQPEGNATSAIFDERDVLFRTTNGALTPPPLALLAPSDPTDYDVRGAIPCDCTTYHYDRNMNLIETVDGMIPIFRRRTIQIWRVSGIALATSTMDSTVW